MDQEELSKLVVVKHNDLIDASQQLSIYESRILLICISRIDSTEPLDIAAKFILSVSDVADLAGVSHTSAYAALQEAVDRLYQRDIVLLIPSKRIRKTRVRWVYKIDYLQQEGLIELTFTPEVSQLLSEIKRDFTQYKLKDVAGFKGMYTIRIYELVCRWGGSTKTIDLATLRAQLQVTDQYVEWDNFKKWVLNPAVAEVNLVSNIEVSWEPIRQGRSVSKVKFTYRLHRAVKRVTKKVTSTGLSNSVKNPLEPITSTDVTDLQQWADTRKRFGDAAPIPLEFEKLLRERGLW